MNKKVKIGAVMVFVGFFAEALNVVTGQFKYVEALRRLKEISKIMIDIIQVPLFPGHLVGSGLAITRELFAELRKEVKEVVAVLMLTTNPLDPKNKEEAIATLSNGLIRAGELGVTVCSATSFEAWMDGHKRGLKPLTGADLDAAVNLLVEIHVEAITRAKKAGCTVESLDMEYLRGIEFTTFTTMEIAYRVIKAINEKLGYVFCRLLDDIAHAKDSGLSEEARARTRQQAKADGAYGTSHASEPTSRSIIGSGGEEVAQGIESMASDGELTTLMVEIFDPQDAVLEDMRKSIPGFGQPPIPDMAQAMADGLEKVEAVLSGLPG